jgi:hypothetical protein
VTPVPRGTLTPQVQDDVLDDEITTPSPPTSLSSMAALGPTSERTLSEAIRSEALPSRMLRTSTQVRARSPEYEAVDAGFVEAEIYQPLPQQPTQQQTGSVELFDIPERTPPVFKSRAGSLVPLSDAVTEILAAMTMNQSTKSPPPVPEGLEDEVTRSPLDSPDLLDINTRQSAQKIPSPEHVVSRVSTRIPVPVARRVTTRQHIERAPARDSTYQDVTACRGTEPL